MTREELTEAILRTAGLTRANVRRFYDGLAELAKKRLVSEGRFVLPGLGVFVVRTRPPRKGRNPRTGEAVDIPRRKVVRFRAYGDLKAALNPALAGAEPADPDCLEPQGR